MNLIENENMLDIIPDDIKNRKINWREGEDAKALRGERFTIEQNIQAVRSEFIGMPEVCHQIVTHIIHLRRDTSDTQHAVAFFRLLTMYMPTLLEHMNVRWLLSICDTIVDVGSPQQSAVAMNIVQCINRCNLDTTIMVNCVGEFSVTTAVDDRLDKNKLARVIKVPTWGGMTTADVPSGDMLHNMMTRLETVVQLDDILYSIWKRIKELSRNQPGVIMEYIAASSRRGPTYGPHQQEFFK